MSDVIAKDKDYRPRQETKFGYAGVAGYSFKTINGSVSQGYLGVDINYCETTPKYTHYGTLHQLSVGGGVYMGSYNGSFRAIPAINIGYSAGQIFLLDFRIEGSPYYVAPIVSFNTLNLLRFNVGYNIGFKKVNNFDMSGLTVGISLSIGGGWYHPIWND